MAFWVAYFLEFRNEQVWLIAKSARQLFVSSLLISVPATWAPKIITASKRDIGGMNTSKEGTRRKIKLIDITDTLKISTKGMCWTHCSWTFEYTKGLCKLSAAQAHIQHNLNWASNCFSYLLPLSSDLKRMAAGWKLPRLIPILKQRQIVPLCCFHNV